MVQTSIQIRRITDKVGRYFQRFGFRTYSRILERGSVISANKTLGPDRFQCRVAETSRGTAVSFYSINTWTNFLPFLPFLLFGLLIALNEVGGLSQFISGENALFGVNWIRLIGGSFEINVLSVGILILIPSIFSFTLYSMQTIRLANLKNRFSFFTKDAIWEPRDVSSSILSLRGAQTGFTHGWFLAIMFFSLFAMPQAIIDDVKVIYNVDEEQLQKSMEFGFSIISGLLIGLVSGIKSLILRKEQSRFDARLKLTGTYYERRIEPMLFGAQTALVAGALFIPFQAITFSQTGAFANAAFTVTALAIGGIVAGSIYEEGPVWLAGSYIALLFFTSIALVFRTGQEPALAFVVILILFFSLVPFFLLSSVVFDTVLRRYRINTVDFHYDYFPFNPIWSIIQTQRRIQRTIQAYEESLAEEHIIAESGVLLIDKALLHKKGGELAERIAKHYFQLLTVYNSMFDEEEAVLVPTNGQLIEWWAGKVGKRDLKNQVAFLNFTDRLLWDPEFFPEQNDLKKFDNIGFNMVIDLER
ncbi:MAG: hypothetical protein D6732_15190 [Methanobacteriota archaeon]|nr:MAG: hypothetical protein D6732_15190 [Euryarchaeota archaeon]